MNKTILGVIIGLAVAGGVYLLLRGAPAKAGPNGGDLVPLDGGGYSEVLANADTGELMVHTWNDDLKTAKPIESQPLTVGSGERSAELSPHPMPGDPPGRCSRFYGQADWARGGAVTRGWMHQAGHAGHRHEFDWRRCWEGGRSHGAMWTEMGAHRRRGGMGHGGDHSEGHAPPPSAPK